MPCTPSMTALFTIGYEQATSAAVLEELREANIDLVIDVRAIAASRRPGFSKRQLAADLDQLGLRYLHFRSLGTPAEGRLAARSGRIDDLFRIYENHLATPGACEQLDELTALVRSGQRICLVCYERNPHHCHRRRVAELVQQRTGVAVTHLAARLV